MKGIYLTKYGRAEEAFEIREIEKPKPGPNEVLIKVECFGLNFADVIARRGLYPDAPKNPALLGYDVAGTVEAWGSDVHDFEIGDRVAALTRFGGYAEYAVTMQEGVAKIPENFDMDLSTALATQACTAFYCAEDCVTLHKGDNVLIHAAAGGVGTILVQIAKHRGCTVFGTASSGKQDYLKSLGVDYPIDYTKEDFSGRIKEILGGNKLDVVFDSIGGKTFKQSYKLLQPGGAMVNFGAASQLNGGKIAAIGMAINFGFYSPIQLLMSSKSLNAVNMLRIADYKPRVFKEVFTGVMEMVKTGVINPHIAQKFKADQIAEAHALLESRKSVGKVVVRW
ncbi:MAG: zinc-binding dehydrogenase [Saprospiraceae bacterium]|nr:zinc-binding dehydrogenase [Saprospiraceae bacterium]